MEKKIKAVILAAGKGTRLRTEGCDLPKVMRSALGKPLLSYVLDSLSFIPKEDIVIVVGYQKEKVMEYFSDYTFAVQDQQLGTGHAVMSACDLLKDFDGQVLVCCGDMPLVSRKSYETLAKTHLDEGCACTMLTGITDMKLAYGRILRDENGDFVRVVEDKDCTPEQREIKELNSGIYMFDCKELLDALTKLKNNNAQGEYYLTDVPEIMRSKGLRLSVYPREMGNELIGVNTVEQLREVESIIESEK